mgnify:CR=1 FL=1
MFIASALKADEKDETRDKEILLKLKKIRTLGDIQENSCDLCGCFFGIEPNFAQNSVGVRYSYFKFYSPAHNEPVNPNLDHEGHTGVEETEIYSKVELFAKYNATPKLRFLLTLPYKFIDINGKQIKDFGDASLLAQYQIYATPPSLKEESQYRQRVYVGAGLKVPTGAFNKQLEYGITEPHFQPGTGAFDFLVSTSYFSKYKDFGFNADASYSIATKNKNEYKFGNRLNVTSSLFYQVETGQTGLLPHAGIYLEAAEHDKLNEVEDPNSGGSVLFITGGIDVYYSSFSLNFTYQHPINDRLFGSQTPNKFRAVASLSYYFGM